MPLPFNEANHQLRIRNPATEQLEPLEQHEYGDNYAENIRTYRNPVTNETVVTFKPYLNLKSLIGIGFDIVTTENGNTIITSRLVLIGDVDIDDDDWLTRWAETKTKYPDLKFRLYRTYKGYRFFLVNQFSPIAPLYVDGQLLNPNYELTHNLFTDFQCDKLYVDQVWLNKRYAARLSLKNPKLRDTKEMVVCNLLESDIPVSKMPWEIAKTIQIHDCFVLN
jgi:hypothetical protein